MSDEREILKPPSDESDFQAHVLKPPHATDEPDDAEAGKLRQEAADEGEDFEGHILKPPS